MTESLFDELKRYVQFGPSDERALAALHPIAQPHFARYAEVFYDRILRHDGARRALGGESAVGHLKVTLVAWMERLLQGPWDDAYFELRCRIGRVHVRIALPQHYMFGAMNVLREQLYHLADTDGAAVEGGRSAISKILDLELAIMLHTYAEEHLAARSRQERLAMFGQLVGSMGHELRNPLGVMETSLHILKGRAPDDSRSQKHLDRIGEQIGVANKIITNLLDMIRDRPVSREHLRLHQVVADAMEAVPAPQSVAVRHQGLEALPAVVGDRSQLRQLFVNLLENSLQAVGAAGEVWVRGERSGSFAQVAVEDSGPGVDEATRARLFEPLVTTKNSGVGLGLALVRKIVQRHSGSVSYEPRPGGGARFVLLFPVEAA